MDQAFKEFERQALLLPSKERALLAERLIASLNDGEDIDAERFWLEEAEKRYREYRKGGVTARPADEALADAREALR